MRAKAKENKETAGRAEAISDLNAAPQEKRLHAESGNAASGTPARSERRPENRDESIQPDPHADRGRPSQPEPDDIASGTSGSPARKCAEPDVSARLDADSEDPAKPAPQESCDTSFDELIPDRAAKHTPVGPENDTSDGPGLAPELQSRLEDMIKQLSHSLKLRSFYPKGHSAVAPSLAQFKRHLDAALEDLGEITIGSTGDKLVFEGQPFGGDKRPLLNLAKHLKVRNVSGIAFRSGVTEVDIENLLELLSGDPETFASPEMSPELESSMQHIGLMRVDYGSVLKHVSDDEVDLSTPDGPHDMWKSLVTQQLLRDGDELSDQAREMIARSAGDKAALEEMTNELVRAGSASAGDPTACVARGLVKTCKGMETMAGAQREQGMANLADIVARMDPQVMAHLAETEAADAVTGNDLIQEITQKLPVKAKIRLLTALVNSQRMDKSRLSSVFRRVAGARGRRQELLEKMRQEASHASPTEAPQFNQVCSAIQDLVLTESEDRFVGSDYVSMLEELGECTLDPGEAAAEDSGCLEEFRKTLNDDQKLELKTRFLIDLSRLQEDTDELAKTLNDIKNACGELCKTESPELLTEILVDLADDLSKSVTPDSHRATLLQDCLKTLAAGEAAQPALERLLNGESECADSLEAALSACGPDACPNVWHIVSRSDAAAENPQIVKYLTHHSDIAAEVGKEILAAGPLPEVRRVLGTLSLLGTPEAVKVMEWALENGEQGAHREIVRALIAMRGPAAREALRGLLAGGDKRLMLLTASSLGAAGAQHAVPILLEFLKTLDVFGRKLTEVQQVAAALGKIGNEAAVPYLERLLTRRLCTSSASKKEFRKTVALALRNIGGDEASLVLQRNASCFNRQVREACKLALSRPERTPRRAGPDWDDVDFEEDPGGPDRPPDNHETIATTREGFDTTATDRHCDKSEHTYDDESKNKEEEILP